MDKCVFCGGQLKEELVTFVYEDDHQYFFVEHVPAEVCSKCGERTYSPDLTDMSNPQINKYNFSEGIT